MIPDNAITSNFGLLLIDHDVVISLRRPPWLDSDRLTALVTQQLYKNV